MNKNIIIVILALITGSILGYNLPSINTIEQSMVEIDIDQHNEHNKSKPTDESVHTMTDMMDDMTASLQGKVGKEFDAQFLDDMIIHHEGAVLMAEMALINAEDERIKNLAKNIIEAQEKEIADMKSWQSTVTDKP